MAFRVFFEKKTQNSVFSFEIFSKFFRKVDKIFNCQTLNHLDWFIKKITKLWLNLYFVWSSEKIGKIWLKPFYMNCLTLFLDLS